MKIVPRIGVLAVSLLVLSALTEIAGKAAITLTTPNSAVVSYTLAAGGTSAAITPVTSQPVIVIGANTVASNASVSSITLVHIPGAMIHWVGLEGTTGAVVHGGSAALGTHIVWLDASSKVSLEVFSADQFVINNGSATSQTGSVKLIW